MKRPEWMFTTGCRLNVHGFDDPADKASCVCGLTTLRQRKGGWDAVWNTRGVGFASASNHARILMRRRDWSELARLCRRALREDGGRDWVSLRVVERMALNEQGKAKAE